MNRIEIRDVESIKSVKERILNKELKVVDLVRSHLDFAKKTNPELNAFITIFDESIEKARAIDKLIEENDPTIKDKKLLGIPFTAKDLYLVKDTRTTFASKYMEDFIAPYTSTVLQRCLDEGAILIGKCNCDPWGFGGSGENSGFGPTKHPLDFEKTPGGSSSGSASSLLAGIGFFSLGTDTGGSVRLPASFCGLYGLKPTYGRNSRYGIGSMGSSFDTPGFFTRNIEDMRFLEEIMGGFDSKDATTIEGVFSNERIEKKPIIGIPTEFMNGLTGDIRVSLEQFIERLKSQNFEVKDISLPSSKYALAVYYILVPSEISSNRARYDGVRFGKKVSDEYEENMILGRSKYFEDEVKRRIMIGTYSLSKGYSDQFYKKASKVRSKIKNEFLKVFEEVDLILSPVSPTTAFKLGEKLDDPVQMYLVDIYTVLANLAGIPALAFPYSKDSNGMPIGFQVMGNNYNENILFSFAEDLKSI